MPDTRALEVKPPVPETEPARQKYFIGRLKDWTGKRKEELGREVTCAVVTFGCQMNAHDSEKILGVLTEAGFVPTEDEHADLVLYNTCTVRENADVRVYGRLGRLKDYKKKNPEMIIALCGCMMQEQHVIDKLQKSYRFVDLILGTMNNYKVAELLWNRIETGRQVIEIRKDSRTIVEDLPVKRKYPFKSGLNIMFGCNNFCTYCIVPYVRGREKSREPKDIIRECERLARSGVVEVMLLGQNVNSYGNTLENPVSFAELLREIEKVEGIERIRFMTSHPKDLSDELIAVIKESKKICRHLHLPVQSGSSEILKKMNRHYTKEQYLRLAEKIRREIPDIAITTDIIVGFPGETEEDFLETLDVMDKVRFEGAFTFIYSRRTGTPAARMENQVPEDVVKDRFDRLLRKMQELTEMNGGKYLGTVQEVLVEEPDDHQEGWVSGRLSNNTVVHLPGGRELIGKIVPVYLDESKGFYYTGYRINQEEANHEA